MRQIIEVSSSINKNFQNDATVPSNFSLLFKIKVILLLHIFIINIFCYTLITIYHIKIMKYFISGWIQVISNVTLSIIIPLNSFLLGANFNKSIVRLDFFFFGALHEFKISR